MSGFEDIKGLKLPGVDAKGNFPSKHPQFIIQNGKSVINPAWNKDQAILREQAKEVVRMNQQDIMKDAARHEKNMYKPKPQNTGFRFPGGTKLPGVLGIPFLLQDFMHLYNLQTAPEILPSGAPKEI